MSDVVIQATGSMAAAMQFCKDNDVAISDIPVTGMVYTVSDTAMALGNEDMLRYLNNNEVTVGTLGDTTAPVLNARILLKPVLQHVPNTANPPVLHAGRYDFDLKEAPGFIHVHPVPNIPFPNLGCFMNYSPVYDYTTGLPPTVGQGTNASGTGQAMMVDKDVRYIMLWVGLAGHFLVWDAGLGGASTFTFRDVYGNEAMHSPFLILDDASQDAIGYMIADLDMEVVSATDTTCTVRLTRSHLSSAYPEYATHSMVWLLGAMGSSPDPLDPANPDKRILTFPGPGRYTIGVGTNYTYLTYTWPPSRMTMVIEVY
ncbi:MAG: hypothetical protein K0Q79_1496 [Flavipsychrobacter sp.]|nr:hypothetical protein [Flavipsychrobacter sp.]